jgi:hypothetical protein
MNPTPTMPELTAFDAVTQLVAAALYLAIGAAALGQAPRDERTRVFAALGVMHTIAFCIPAGAWFLGVKDPLAFNRIPLTIMLAALSVAAMLMFHFSQVFPLRRPWIRGSGIQLPVAYALTPIVVFMLVRWWPGTPQQVTMKFGLVFLVFGFPLMVLLGLVLPVASIVSFLRTLRETAPGAGKTAAAYGAAPLESSGRGSTWFDTGDGGVANARPAVAGILLSQLAGGALSLLVLGPLHAVAPDSISVTFVALAVWFLGLLTPLAYAAGVWRYNVLAIGQKRSAEVEPD